MANEDTGEELVFLPDEPEGEQALLHEPWKVLVVDDEKLVHAATRLVLDKFVFENRALELIHAYSQAEAEKLLSSHSDIALAFLDIVMEENDSGLQLVKYIREKLHNKLIRLILRTGQPGYAPEKQVILDYDINDYKLKTDLSADKLFTTVVASLRSYQYLQSLEHNRKGLELIIDSAGNFFKQQSFKDFVTGTLMQLTSLMHLNNSALYCRTSGISAQKEGDDFIIIAGTGIFSKNVNQIMSSVLPEESLQLVSASLEKRETIYYRDCFVVYFASSDNVENVIFMQSSYELNEWDKHLLSIFCNNISVALDNLLLNKEVDTTQKEIIYTLGEIAEARSKETGQHVKRVAEYCRLLAKLYGMTKEQAELIYLASPMHDVGKLAIPDAILNKPGKLTPDEYESVKTHAQAGHDMLKKSTRQIMKVAATIALEHHERYDGRGYPDGKEKNEISPFSKIVAISDVFDALISNRVYKNQWSAEEVNSFFAKERGRHFDPDLTDLFLLHFDKFLAIKSAYPD